MRAKAKDRIFINYRRDDAAGFAGRLADSLADYFGPGRVFRDVTGIDYGDDFEEVIHSRLAESGALVVIIGDRWTNVRNADGGRRLDDPGDYVGREISVAMKAGLPVVPVLIGNAAMPRPDELPEPLRELSRHNAMTVTDERWAHDVARLAKVLAIDVPGSVAQRRLDRVRTLALLLLVLAGIAATFTFARAVGRWAPQPTSLRDAGFAPLVSAVPFIAILIAATLTLSALPAMEASRRKYGWAAIGLAGVGTFAAFVNYAINNVAAPSQSLIVNFAAGAMLTLAMLALLALAGFRAK